MLTELRTALASRIDARVTSRTQEHQFQDFTNIVHYYPAEVWGSEEGLVDRLATVLDLPCGLGLQISSETNVQVVAGAYLCVSEGCVTKAANQSADNKLVTLRYVEAQLQQLFKTQE